jgi:hypothetical protein
VEKKKSSKRKFYGVGILFLLVVSIVEVVKNVIASKAFANTIHQQGDSSLIVLPIFSIAVVLLLAIPRKNF